MKQKNPPNGEWYDVYGNFKGKTNKQKEADWLRRLKIARNNTRKTIATTRKPIIDKKDE